MLTSLLIGKHWPNIRYILGGGLLYYSQIEGGGEVTYCLDEDDMLFYIDPSNGDLCANFSADRETLVKYKVYTWGGGGLVYYSQVEGGGEVNYGLDKNNILFYIDLPNGDLCANFSADREMQDT